MLALTAGARAVVLLVRRANGQYGVQGEYRSGDDCTDADSLRMSSARARRYVAPPVHR